MNPYTNDAGNEREGGRNQVTKVWQHQMRYCSHIEVLVQRICQRNKPSSLLNIFFSLVTTRTKCSRSLRPLNIPILDAFCSVSVINNISKRPPCENASYVSFELIRESLDMTQREISSEHLRSAIPSALVMKHCFLFQLLVMRIDRK